MNPTTSGGGYHPLTPHSEGSVRDAKGASVRDVGVRDVGERVVGERVVVHQSAILRDQKVAPTSNAAPSAAPTAAPRREAAPSGEAAPSRPLTGRAKKLLEEENARALILAKGMKFAAEMDRVTGPFNVFVKEACPSISGPKFAEAVKKIALFAPTHSLDTDEQAVAYMTNFLPPPEVWRLDRQTPKARVDHLMWVLALYEFNLQMREAREFGVAGPPGEQLKFTARELWLIDLPG